MILIVLALKVKQCLKAFRLKIHPSTNLTIFLFVTENGIDKKNKSQHKNEAELRTIYDTIQKREQLEHFFRMYR